VAAAPANGVGMVGVWPGARALNLPLDAMLTCGRRVAMLAEAIRRRAAVINMSYGASRGCHAEEVALQYVVASGIVPVAAAGNEFNDGNPPAYPATYPHVLTVASVGAAPEFLSSPFSNVNEAIDLSAPGERIMTAVPPALDADGVQDGYERLDGTSFAAPMVAAAVAWVRAARPELTADQVNQAVRLSAADHDEAGWQPHTGFGVLNLRAALRYNPPPPDPAEPNDDMYWVDGRAFERPDRLIYKGGRQTRFGATIDVFEDPADVYRIRLRPRSRVKISANPVRNDDVDLRVYPRRAKSLGAKPVERSARRGRRTERVTLRNRSRRARVYYVAVRVQRNVSDLDAAYALRVG
jgi:Subtilase family